MVDEPMTGPSHLSEVQEAQLSQMNWCTCTQKDREMHLTSQRKTHKTLKGTLGFDGIAFLKIKFLLGQTERKMTTVSMHRWLRAALSAMYCKR